MRITVNGKRTNICEDITLGELLSELQLSGQRLAIELNEIIVSRSHSFEARLGEGDHAEIVRAIDGG